MQAFVVAAMVMPATARADIVYDRTQMNARDCTGAVYLKDTKTGQQHIYSDITAFKEFAAKSRQNPALDDLGRYSLGKQLSKAREQLLEVLSMHGSGCWNI